VPESEGSGAYDPHEEVNKYSATHNRRTVGETFSDLRAKSPRTPEKTPSSENNVYCSKYEKYFESENKTCGNNNKTLCKDCKHAFIRRTPVIIKEKLPIYCVCYEVGIDEMNRDVNIRCQAVNDVSDCIYCESAYIPVTDAINRINSIARPHIEKPLIKTKPSRFEQIIE
jgi:hypothetical protein